MSNDPVRPGRPGPKMRAVGTVPGENGKPEIVYVEEPTLREQWRQLRPAERLSITFPLLFFFACIAIDFVLDRVL